MGDISQGQQHSSHPKIKNNINLLFALNPWFLGRRAAEERGSWVGDGCRSAWKLQQLGCRASWPGLCAPKDDLGSGSRPQVPSSQDSGPFYTPSTETSCLWVSGVRGRGPPFWQVRQERALSLLACPEATTFFPSKCPIILLTKEIESSSSR